jgi:hypothetical protein
MGKKVTTVTETKLSPGGQAATEAAVPFIQDFAAHGLPPAQTNTVTPFNATQTAAQNAAVSAAGGAGDLATQTAQQQQFIASGAAGDPNNNPNLKATIDYAVDPVRQAYQDATAQNRMDWMGAEGNSAGFGGSRMFNAQNRALNDEARQIGGISSTIANDAYGKGLDASVKALALAPQTQQMGLLPARTLGAVGDVQQQQAQTELDAANNAQRQNDMQAYLMAQALLGIGNADPAKGASTTAPAPKTDWLSTIAGGAATAAGLIPFL